MFSSTLVAIDSGGLEHLLVQQYSIVTAVPLAVSRLHSHRFHAPQPNLTARTRNLRGLMHKSRATPGLGFLGVELICLAPFGVRPALADPEPGSLYAHCTTLSCTVTAAQLNLTCRPNTVMTQLEGYR